MHAKDRIIVALDVDEAMDLDRFAGQLEGDVGMFKLGLEAMTSIGGPQAVDIARRHRIDVFYDGKFHDIPNTVAGACSAAALMGVRFMNVHASGGRAMMRAAAEVKRGATLLAVTVLTSLDDAECEEIYREDAEMQAVMLAMIAMESGCDGIICSPKEIAPVRRAIGQGPLIVTPGVRPEWASKDDQSRVMTPGEAVKAGADYLVIGRPILKAAKYGMQPFQAVRRIAHEIEEALA